MLSLFDQMLLREIIAEGSRLLLVSAAAGYVGANVRRLAARHGWDTHLLQISQVLATALPGTRRRRRLWLTIGAAGMLALTLLIRR
jgi:hypothetical protein